MLKQPNFFYSQPSTLPKEALAKFYLSMTFGLSFMISSVAPTRWLTSYAYLNSFDSTCCACFPHFQGSTTKLVASV